jgi:hypothetical protein
MVNCHLARRFGKFRQKHQILPSTYSATKHSSHDGREANSQQNVFILPVHVFITPIHVVRMHAVTVVAWCEKCASARLRSHIHTDVIRILVSSLITSPITRGSIPFTTQERMNAHNAKNYTLIQRGILMTRVTRRGGGGCGFRVRKTRTRSLDIYLWGMLKH